MENGLAGYGTLVSKDYETFVALMLKLTGQMTILFDSVAERDRWINNTKLGLVIELTGDNNIGTSSEKHSVKIEIPQIVYTNFSESRGTDEIQEQTIDFTAELNGADGANTIKITTKNGVATY